MDLLTEPAEYVFAGNEIWRIVILIVIIALSLFLGRFQNFFCRGLNQNLKTEAEGCSPLQPKRHPCR